MTAVTVDPTTDAKDSCNNWRCCWKCCWKSKCGKKREVIIMSSETGRTRSYGSDHSTNSVERVAGEIIRGEGGRSEITIDKVHIHVTPSVPKNL